MVGTQEVRLVGRGGRPWDGYDDVDFVADRPPTYSPAPDAEGIDRIAGDDPFIMQVDGKAWLFAPTGLKDGPLPAHYEPEEGIVENALYGQQCNPARMEWPGRKNPYHSAYNDPRFPYVITTYRLTEHHTAGAMSSWLSWLAELQPEMFCEVSPELAREKGLENGGWATVRTARGEIECRVLVTETDRLVEDQGSRGAPDRPSVPLGTEGSRDGRRGERADLFRRRPQRLDPGVEGADGKHRTGTPEPG